MNEAIEAVENEEFGLDDLIEAEEKESEQKQRESAQQQEEESKPDNFELEKARLLASKMNWGFLFAVNKLVCPSIDNIDEYIDREAGNEAFVPLALEMGGEVPEWVLTLQKKYGPYFVAGAYAAGTIYSLKQVEKQIKQAENEAPEAPKNDGSVEDGKE